MGDYVGGKWVVGVIISEKWVGGLWFVFSLVVYVWENFEGWFGCD